MSVSKSAALCTWGLVCAVLSSEQQQHERAKEAALQLQEPLCADHNCATLTKEWIKDWMPIGSDWAVRHSGSFLVYWPKADWVGSGVQCSCKTHTQDHTTKHSAHSCHWCSIQLKAVSLGGIVMLQIVAAAACGWFLSSTAPLGSRDDSSGRNPDRKTRPCTHPDLTT